MSKVTGYASLNRQLTQLTNRVVKRATRQVLNRAATPMLKSARQFAPVLRGHLKKALGKRTWMNAAKAKAGAVIGVKDNYRVPNPNWKQGSREPKTFFPKNYLHLVIYGTAAHVGPDGAKIAAAAPNDFLTRAKTATAAAARQIIEDGMDAAIKEAAAKIGKRKAS